MLCFFFKILEKTLVYYTLTIPREAVGAGPWAPLDSTQFARQVRTQYTIFHVFQTRVHAIRIQVMMQF